MSSTHTITAEYALADMNMTSFKKIFEYEFNTIIALSSEYEDISHEKPPILADTSLAEAKKRKEIERLAETYEPLYRQSKMNYDNFMARKRKIFLREELIEDDGVHFFETVILGLNQYERLDRHKKRYAAVYAERARLCKAMQEYAPYSKENIHKTIEKALSVIRSNAKSQHSRDVYYWENKRKKRMQEINNDLRKRVGGFAYVIKNLSISTTDSMCTISCMRREYYRPEELFTTFHTTFINKQITFSR